MAKNTDNDFATPKAMSQFAFQDLEFLPVSIRKSLQKKWLSVSDFSCLGKIEVAFQIWQCWSLVYKWTKGHQTHRYISSGSWLHPPELLACPKETLHLLGGTIRGWVLSMLVIIIYRVIHYTTHYNTNRFLDYRFTKGSNNLTIISRTKQYTK